jgi:hypothetical protein
MSKEKLCYGHISHSLSLQLLISVSWKICKDCWITCFTWVSNVHMLSSIEFPLSQAEFEEKVAMVHRDIVNHVSAPGSPVNTPLVFSGR